MSSQKESDCTVLPEATVLGVAEEGHWRPLCQQFIRQKQHQPNDLVTDVRTQQDMISNII